MEEIGRRLQAAREAGGITLQVAEEETKIRRKYLEALESARVVDIPGEAYLKGFLRTYGNYLGLDGAALVEEYKRLAEPAPAQAATNAPEPASKPIVKLLERKPELPPVHTAERREPDRATARRAAQVASNRGDAAPDTAALRLIGMVAVTLVVLSALGYGGWRMLKPAAAPKPKDVPPVTNKTEPPKPTNPTPTQPEQPKITMTRGQGEEVLFAVAGAKEIQVRLEFGAERVWMKGTVDGQDKYEGFPNAPLEFKGSQIRLRMGFMDGVSVIINGQRFDHKLAKGPYTLIFQGQ